jgi:hypothetical protein
MKIVNCCWLIEKKLINSIGSWPIEDNHLIDLPISMRRRLTPLGRKTLQMLNKCIVNSDNKSIPWVISCRHGDITRRLNLLSSLVQSEMLSPTDFSLSVHNAIIGMYSIASGNKLTHTALAAGIDSFESGLLEAIALHKEKGESIGYVYYDYLEIEDGATEQLNSDSPIECIAFVLSNNEEQGGVLVEYKKKNTSSEASKKFNTIEFLDFLKNDQREYSISVAGGEILFQHNI